MAVPWSVGVRFRAHHCFNGRNPEPQSCFTIRLFTSFCSLKNHLPQVPNGIHLSSSQKQSVISPLPSPTRRKNLTFPPLTGTLFGVFLDASLGHRMGVAKREHPPAPARQTAKTNRVTPASSKRRFRIALSFTAWQRRKSPPRMGRMARGRPELKWV